MSNESLAANDARVDVAALLGAVTQRLPRILLVTLALLAATFVVMLFVPRLYESSASILVEPRSNVYSRAANEQAPTFTGSEAGVVSSQIALIQSRDTLLKVIDELDLRSVSEFNGSGGNGFSPIAIITQLLGRKATPMSIDETVLGNLTKNLSVVQERDSRLISIQMLSRDPQLAADIANAIANAHVARRAQLSLSDTAEASDWLRAEIERLRQVVKDTETAVADFKINNDLFTGNNNTSLLDQQLSAIATQISAAQERKNTAISRAEMIRGMLERGQSIEGVADVRDSVVIQRLSEEKARLQGEKAQRSATLLSSHPAIRALTAQISELDNQIAIEGRRVADALDAEAQIEADLEASLKADLTGAKVTASTATQDTVTLDGLQREAKAQRDLLEGYLQRYNEAFSRTETSSALPDVRVVSVAAPSILPASPKTQLILIAVGVVSLAVQIGLVTFGELMSGRAIIEAPVAARTQDELDEAPFSEDELEPDQQYDDDAHGEYVGNAFGDDVVATAAEPYASAEYDNGTDHAEGSVSEYPDVVQAPTLATQPVAMNVESINEWADAAPHDAGVNAAATFNHSGEAAVPGLVSLATLTEDLLLGRSHLVMLASNQGHEACQVVAEEIVAEALARGLSAALVDAGSGRVSEQAGLSDLSADAASFGDVVQKSADSSYAEVPWGRARAISRKSTKLATLIEALGDIYEVVVVMTGRVGMNSALPLFGDAKGRIVLVAGAMDDEAAIADSRAQLIEAGFEKVEVAQGAARVAA